MKTNRPFNSASVRNEVQTRMIKDREISRPQFVDQSTRAFILFVVIASLAGVVLYALGYIDKF